MIFIFIYCCNIDSEKPLGDEPTKYDESEYMKIHIFELRKKQWISDWSSQLFSQLKQLRKESLKKIQAWTGFEPMTSAIPVKCSTNWAIKPTGSWSIKYVCMYVHSVNMHVIQNVRTYNYNVPSLHIITAYIFAPMSGIQCFKIVWNDTQAVPPTN